MKQQTAPRIWMGIALFACLLPLLIRSRSQPPTLFEDEKVTSYRIEEYVRKNIKPGTPLPQVETWLLNPAKGTGPVHLYFDGKDKFRGSAVCRESFVNGSNPVDSCIS